MPNILTLATAGIKPEQFADGQNLAYPRIDYVELQRMLDIDVIDYGAYNQTYFGQFFRRLETRIRSDLYLTWLGLLAQRSYRLVFAMSERAGIPYAASRRLLPRQRPFVAMFTCWSERQERMITALHLFEQMDSIIVHCTSMRDHFVELGVEPEKIHVIHYGVDHNFFTPQSDIEQEPGFIFSLGETRSRDYASLFESIEGLPLHLLVAASGRWYAREKEKDVAAAVPVNVTLGGGFTLAKVRELYAQSQFVVLPIHDAVYSAGVTAVLEAMCMERAVIVTRSRGLTDFVVDDETGLVVEPQNPAALREAIQFLLANPAEARRMGKNARQRVEEKLNLDIHVARVAELLQSYL